jgi:hypothetical protein
MESASGAAGLSSKSYTRSRTEASHLTIRTKSCISTCSRTPTLHWTADLYTMKTLVETPGEQCAAAGRFTERGFDNDFHSVTAIQNVRGSLSPRISLGVSWFAAEDAREFLNRAIRIKSARAAFHLQHRRSRRPEWHLDQALSHVSAIATHRLA